MATPKFALGDTLRDHITGFEGVVIARTEWLNGCVRYDLQPPTLDKDGQPVKDVWFDEEQVALRQAAELSVPSHGGPMPAPSRAADPRR